jgi:hypothetical protein
MVRPEVKTMYAEFDPKVINVLDLALRSSSRTVRLRAVCMLANVSCERRAQWLATACRDGDDAVRQAASTVTSWTLAVEPPPWPQREDPAFDRVMHLAEPEELLDAGAGLGWEWEYAVEVWRDDGMLVGVFLCTTCQDDNEHAKRIALGQAVLASAGPTGDRFEPSTAAAFIVAKRRVRRNAYPRVKKREGRQR